MAGHRAVERVRAGRVDSECPARGLAAGRGELDRLTYTLSHSEVVRHLAIVFEIELHGLTRVHTDGRRLKAHIVANRQRDGLRAGGRSWRGLRGAVGGRAARPSRVAATCGGREHA